MFIIYIRTTSYYTRKWIPDLLQITIRYYKSSNGESIRNQPNFIQNFGLCLIEFFFKHFHRMFRVPACFILQPIHIIPPGPVNLQKKFYSPLGVRVIYGTHSFFLWLLAGITKQTSYLYGRCLWYTRNVSLEFWIRHFTRRVRRRV